MWLTQTRFKLILIVKIILAHKNCKDRANLLFELLQFHWITALYSLRSCSLQEINNHGQPILKIWYSLESFHNMHYRLARRQLIWSDNSVIIIPMDIWIAEWGRERRTFQDYLVCLTWDLKGISSLIAHMFVVTFFPLTFLTEGCGVFHFHRSDS